MSQAEQIGFFSKQFLDFESPRPMDVPEGPLHFAWRLKLMDSDEFSKLSPSTDQLNEIQLAYLASFGHLAPTSHNTQPHRFQLNPEDESITVYVDRQYILPASDIVGRQATVSLGTVIGTIDVAAGCFGLKMKTQTLENSEYSFYPSTADSIRYVPAVKIHFQKNQEKQDPSWLKAILTRKVVRAEGNPGVILPDELKSAMHGIVEKYPELNLHLITDSLTKLGISTFQGQGDARVVKNEKFARELGDWLQANDSDSYLGMRGIEFGLNNEASHRYSEGLQHLEDPAKRLQPDDINGFANSGKKHVWSASALGVITANLDDPTHRILTGRAFAELALYLELSGYNVSVRAALTEVDSKNYRLPMVESLMSRLIIAKRPEMLFTIGKPKDPKDLERPHSVRMPIEAVLYTAKH